LAHLESCAACREEVGIDQALVMQLRRALRERVEGGSPSQASWDLVRRRTVDRPVQPWTRRALRVGGLLPAAFAAIMMFAITTSPNSGLIDRTQAPSPGSTPNAQTAVEPFVQATDVEPPLWTEYRAQRSMPPAAVGQSDVPVKQSRMTPLS
jgi:anti-sigma factor RsiW